MPAAAGTRGSFPAILAVKPRTVGRDLGVRMLAGCRRLARASSSASRRTCCGAGSRCTSRSCEPADALEILAHRIFWSMVTMGLLVVVLRRTRQFRALFADRRVFGFLTLAAFVITFNWATYIYGVTHDRVVETSLGYFINPLVTVLMGVLLLGERLRRLQWLALGVGALACLVLTVDYGRPPWIALVLAFSFGTYGLAKKQAGAEAVESLALETLLIAPFAAAYVGWLVASGGSTFGTEGAGHTALLATTGLVTAVPLLCFGAAAIRVSMTTLGLLQYLAPVLQFLLGRALVPRGDVTGPLGRLRAGLGGAVDLHRGGRAAPPSASCG